MAEKLYKQAFVHVLEIAGSKSRICAIGEDEWSAFWVPTDKLTDPKAPRIPIWRQQVNTVAANLPSVDSELLREEVALVSSIRIICPARLEENARQLFDREGVVYPENWRGTELGKRGGTTETGSEKWHDWKPLENGAAPFTCAFDTERNQCKKTKKPVVN